jgi:hypothetical protein
MVVIAKMLVAVTDNCEGLPLPSVMGRLGWETDDTGTLPTTSYRGQGFPRELLKVTLCRVLRPFSTFSTNSDHHDPCSLPPLVSHAIYESWASF